MFMQNGVFLHTDVNLGFFIKQSVSCFYFTVVTVKELFPVQSPVGKITQKSLSFGKFIKNGWNT